MAGGGLAYELSDDEREAVKAAMELLEGGGRLPAPSTWTALVVGVTAWLELRWSNPDGSAKSCPACGSDEWLLGQVLGLSSDPRWPAPPGNGYGSYPFLQLGCQSCGDTAFLDMLLVFEPQEPWSGEL